MPIRNKLSLIFKGIREKLTTISLFDTWILHSLRFRMDHLSNLQASLWTVLECQGHQSQPQHPPVHIRAWEIDSLWFSENRTQPKLINCFVKSSLKDQRASTKWMAWYESRGWLWDMFCKASKCNSTVQLHYMRSINWMIHPLVNSSI